ncbi:MAG TPA: hypothetical protein PLM00_05220 [Spirochaetota bacterium]|nr:hypothetical protein [Spirochaetota bacterium]HPN82770.1 hypothetical protein [Spirochaetota bacterium]
MALWDSMEKFVNESVRVSREAYERAKEVGSLTKKELELKNLQGKLQKEYARLGGLAYHVLGEEQQDALVASDDKVTEMLSAIGVLALKIEDKQQEITLLRDEIDERRRIVREEGKDSDQ